MPQRHRRRSRSDSARRVSAAAEKLIPITFVVIVATALLYGLSGAPVAKALGVSRTGPGGVLIIGASRGARAIARALKDRGVTAVIWTSDHELEKAASDEGLTVYRGDPTAVGAAIPPPELDDVENALLMTDDDGLNGMLAADLGQYFGHDRVYQLAPSGGDDIDFYVRSRVLFDESATHHELEARLKRGAVVDALTVELGWPSRGRRRRHRDVRPLARQPSHRRRRRSPEARSGRGVDRAQPPPPG